MNSMTGFGQSSFCHGELDVTIEVSSVNKRHLESFASIPREWQSLERPLVEIARKKVSRGRLRIQVRVEQADIDESSLNWSEEALASDLDRLSAFASKRNILFEPDAMVLTQLAAARRADRKLPSAVEVEKLVLEAASKAMEGLVEMRKKEGEKLAEDLQVRIETLEGLTTMAETSARGSANEWREKLLERLRKAELDLDPEDERVLKEVTLFADKADVTEEITRLRSHFEQFRSTMQSEDAKGRKLEFLLQEMSRELNTLCSKSARPETTRLGLEARNEIEKIREQVLNVE